MTKLNKILIAALAAQLLLIAVVLAGRETATITQPAPIVKDFDPEAVARIDIHSPRDDDEGAEAPAVVLARTDEAFVVQSAYGYPADRARVDELLSAVEQMAAREPIATSPGRARQLEVADDRYDRRLVFQDESGEARTLYLGAPAGQGRVAARVAGQDAIFAVQTSVGRSARIREADWMQQPFFEAKSDDIASLAIESEAIRATFTRDEDGAWKLDDEASDVAAPAGEVLDDGAVDAIAREAARIRLAGVAGREPAPEHGLDEPRARIEIELAPAADDDEGDGISVATERFTIVIGADDDDDRVHVRVDDRPFVALVSRSALRDLLDADAEGLFASEEELEEAEEAEGSPGDMPFEPPDAEGLPIPGAGGAAMPPTP